MVKALMLPLIAQRPWPKEASIVIIGWLCYQHGGTQRKLILGEIDGKSHLHRALHLWTSWWQATQIVCDVLFVAERTSVPRWLLTLSPLDIGVSGRKSLDGEDRNLPPVFWAIGDDGWSWCPWEDGKRSGQCSLGNELPKAVHWLWVPLKCSDV